MPKTSTSRGVHLEDLVMKIRQPLGLELQAITLFIHISLFCWVGYSLIIVPVICDNQVAYHSECESWWIRSRCVRWSASSAPIPTPSPSSPATSIRIPLKMPQLLVIFNILMHLLFCANPDDLELWSPLIHRLVLYLAQSTSLLQFDRRSSELGFESSSSPL